eukprot:SAG11_NODE_32622_length_282_cov_0.792350_1_plen_32_part_01
MSASISLQPSPLLQPPPEPRATGALTKAEVDC